MHKAWTKAMITEKPTRMLRLKIADLYQASLAVIWTQVGVQKLPWGVWVFELRRLPS